MSEDKVLIAGGGIAGLVMGLTLHQIGVPFTVFEAATDMRPLGVGINLQPNAVRELFDLGIDEAALSRVGVPAEEWALVGLNGRDVYAEPRGTKAGYRWPQFAAHRGELHMLLYRTLIARAGPQAVQLGARVTAYDQTATGASARIRHADGAVSVTQGSVLIGADGIHSALRAQMYPDQPPIHWGGVIMWRGTVRARPLRTGSSFVGLGTSRKRMVLYPISAPDAAGEALINWIAEVTVDRHGGWPHDGWFRPVAIDDFVHHFEDFRYDWLDVPKLLRGADCAYENPMIDRDPIPSWVDGAVVLIGDAAHAMYPTGSNGASQAIVDARVLGAKMLALGPGAAACRAFDDQLCAPVSELVLRNRGAGPFGLLHLLDERSGGTFEAIDDVIPAAERAAFMANYKTAAGFAMEALNSAPPTIKAGARGPATATGGVP